MQVQQRASHQLGDPPAAIGRERVAGTERPLEEPLDELDLGLADQRAEQSGQEVVAELLGVGVGEGDDVCVEYSQRPPHRVTLATGAAELGRELALLQHRQARLGRDPCAAVTRIGIDHEHLVEQARLAQARRPLGDRADRRGDLARRQHERDRCALGCQQALEGESIGAVGAPRAPGRAREILGEPARRAPVDARGGAHPDAAAAVDRDTAGFELVLQRLVLQRGPRRQPAAAAVGLGRQRQRCAAEPMVLGHGPGRSFGGHCAHALRAASLALGGRLGGERAALLGVKLDVTADRLRALLDEPQLRGQPVAGDDAVGVRARDQPLLMAKAEEPLAGDVHPASPRAPHALRRGQLDRVQAQRRLASGERLDSLGGRVAATVEHDDHLVALVPHLVLVRQCQQASLDPLRLVASGDDDHGAERRIWLAVEGRPDHDRISAHRRRSGRAGSPDGARRRRAIVPAGQPADRARRRRAAAPPSPCRAS